MSFLNVCKHKFSRKAIIVSFLSTYVLSAGLMAIILNFYHIIGIDMPLNVLICLCLFRLAHKNLKDRALSAYYAVFTMIVTMISGSTVSVLIDIFFGVYVYENRDNFIIYLLNMIPTFLACYYFSKYVGNYINRYYIKFSYRVQKKFARYGFILSTLIYALSHINMFVYRMVEDRILLSTINMIIIVAIFFVAMAMALAHSLSNQKQMELELNARAQKDLENYTKKLEDAYGEMRLFRHNYINMLSTLIGFRDKSPEDFDSYLNQIVLKGRVSLDALNNALDRLKFIQIPSVKGLLAAKLTSAEAKGIDIELDIPKTIKDVGLDQLDLSDMIGILLDNAVEELSSGGYESKKLRFGILVDGDETVIVCENTCTKEVPIEKIFLEGYTTKDETNGRGLGLYSLKELSKKRGNLRISANVDKGIFAIMVTIEKYERLGD